MLAQARIGPTIASLSARQSWSASHVHVLLNEDTCLSAVQHQVYLSPYSRVHFKVLSSEVHVDDTLQQGPS